MFRNGLLVIFLSLSAATVVFGLDSEQARYFAGQDMHLKSGKVISYQPQSGQHLLVFEDKLTLTIGDNRYSCDKAVVWLETVSTEYLGQVTIDYDVKAYLSGNVKVKKGKSALTVRMDRETVDNGSAEVLSFRAGGEVFVTADIREEADPRESEFFKKAEASIPVKEPLFVIQPEAVVPQLPSAEPRLFAEQEKALAAKQAKRGLFGGISKPETGKTPEAISPISRPGEVAAAEEGPKFMYPIGIAPAGENPIELQSGTLADGKSIATVTERFYIWQKQDEKDGMLELQADNAVIFYSTNQADVNDANASDQLDSNGAIEAVYLSGDVLLNEGQRTIRADEMYYDFHNKQALAINAVMRSFDPKRNIPIYIRAAKIRQLAENQFSAEDVVVTNSEFYKQQLSVTASKVLITDTIAADEQMGKLSNKSYDIQMHDVKMKLGSTTLLKRKYIRSDMLTSGVPIKKARIGSDNAFGTSLETDWYMSRLLGYREPNGVDSTLNLDIYSKRGVGGGADIEYQREDYFGNMSGYIINDKGKDRLGRNDSRKDLEPDNPLRGRFAWTHRQFLPYHWQLTTGIDYISDEHFFESFFRDEFNSSPKQETYVHLKRIEKNWALSFLGNARINDFSDQLEELPGAEFHLTGESLFEDRFTFYSDSEIARLRQRIGDDHTTNVDENMYSFASTRNEIDMPVRGEGFKFIPFIAGTFAYDDRSGFSRGLVDGTNSAPFGTSEAGIGEAGARFFPDPIWKVYPSVKSRLWDLNQMRHIIAPSITATAYAVNDNAVEQRNTLNAALAQRLQTKRGEGKNQRTVDWMRLDTDVTFVENQGNAEDSGADRFIWAKPFVPMRVLSAPDIFNGDLDSSLRHFETFGPTRNYFGADYIWRVSDTTAVLSDMHYDLQSSVVDQFNVGLARLVWPDLSLYIGNRYLKRTEVYDEKGSNTFTFAATYVLDPRYTLVFAQQFDFDYGANVRSDITLIRSYNRMRYGFTVSNDSSLDRQAIVFSIWPQGIPELAIGKRRYADIGGMTGY